jgi:rhodanese-related sulfurtransferase
MSAVTIDQMLETARAGLSRLSAEQAAHAERAGAVLVDIRPERQRRAEGEVPDALIVERNVLEWRFDPTCAASLPIAGHDLQVVVFCSQGYTSSLAAASLQQLGLHRATDVIGGFQAWRAAGLPTLPGGLSDDLPTPAAEPLRRNGKDQT